MRRKPHMLIHSGFWFYIIFQALYPVYLSKPEGLVTVDAGFISGLVLSMVLNALSFYTCYFSIPLVLRISSGKKRFGVILFAVISLTLLRLVASRLVWMLYDTYNDSNFVMGSIWFWNEIRLNIVMGIYAILIYFLIRSFVMQALKNEVDTKRQAGELALLKSNVNPHFLFNTLNSIYSLVLCKSDEAPGAVTKFSSVMRYVLSESNKEKIMLDREIEYLRDYIALQKFRSNKEGFISLTINGVAPGAMIVPMLLIPFVENSFKHGNREYKPGIIIELNLDYSSILFRVINYTSEAGKLPDKTSAVSGWANVKRRLELQYPGRHAIDKRIVNGQYIVELKLDIR